MVRRWTVGLLACLAAVPLSLAGCSEKHQAAQTLPTPASTTTSPTTAVLPAVGPADFPVPPEARQRTPAGVQAFTRYYIDLLNRQAQTLDSTPLRELSRQCETCNELAKSYEETKAAGHHFRGGNLTVSSMGSGLVEGSSGQTSFVLNESPTTVVDASGTSVEVRSSKTKRFTGGVVLFWDEKQSTWLMAQLDADPL